MSQVSPQRRHDLDWLRVLAVLTVFFYHSTRFFNQGDWHVKNGDTYAWVEVWNVFATRWMMPLFFVISGASLFYAMEKRTGFLRFLRSKVLRLMVPVVLAAFTHSILQVYLERLTHGEFTGSFLEFVPHYFEGVYLHIGAKGNFAFHGMHLWYLLFLFVYSLLLFPLFRWLKSGGRAASESFGRLAALPGMMYILLPLPFVAMGLTIPRGILDVGSGGWGFLFYIWFLIAGFMLVSSEPLQAAVQKQRWLSLVLGIAIATVYSIWRFGQPAGGLDSRTRTYAAAAYSFFGGWALVLAFLGLGMTYLRRDNRFLRYANEAAIAFYVLHQTLMLCIGYYVVQWEIPDIMKWLVIAVLSFAAIMLPYEYGIRRLNIMRFLFGMKLKKETIRSRVL